MIENEYYFLLVCPFYTELRNTHIPRYYRTWPTATKFNLLVNTNSEIKIRTLATCLYHAFRKRETHNSKYINYVPLYHYVNIYHAVHVLFMIFHIYCLWR